MKENVIEWKESERTFSDIFDSVTVNYNSKKKFQDKLKKAFRDAYRGLSDWVDKDDLVQAMPINDLVDRAKILIALRQVQDKRVEAIQREILSSTEGRGTIFTEKEKK